MSHQEDDCNDRPNTYKRDSTTSTSSLDKENDQNADIKMSADDCRVTTTRVEPCGRRSSCPDAPRRRSTRDVAGGGCNRAVERLGGVHDELIAVRRRGLQGDKKRAAPHVDPPLAPALDAHNSLVGSMTSARFLPPLVAVRDDDVCRGAAAAESRRLAARHRLQQRRLLIDQPQLGGCGSTMPRMSHAPIAGQLSMARQVLERAT